MMSLELVLGWTNFALLIAVGLLLYSYLPAYAKAKAKNLATKEDVADITEKVEAVKAAINQEAALLEKRREVYERISDALRVFIDGHGASEKEKESFHSAYSACWLWAPDAFLEKINEFVDVQKAITADAESYSQDKIKEVFGEIMVLMRKDAGFGETLIDCSEYQFVKF